MDKVCYIVCDNMQGALPFIKERLSKQKTTNNRLAVCSLFLSFVVLALEKTIRDQNSRIDELANEVKELKQMRGE